MAQIIHDVDLPNTGDGDPLRTAFVHQNEMNTELYETKVDKVIGQGLSENNYTDAEQTKLSGIEDGAQVNVPINYEDIIGAPESFISFPYKAIFPFVDGNIFTMPDNVAVTDVRPNGSGSDIGWTQVGTTLTFTSYTLVADDYLVIIGHYNSLNIYSPLSGVETVTDDGNTVVVVDNTDPLNPVITFDGVITDGMTIGGSGTVADPLNVIGGSQSFEDVLQVNRTATTSPLIPNATEPTGAVNLQQLQASQKLHNVLIDNNIGNVVQLTGTTMSTIVKTYTIPAGFFSSDCVFETDLTISKIGTAGNITISFGIAPSGTTLPIHAVVTTAANRYINIGRKMTMIKNGLIIGFGVSGNFYSDKIANGGALNKLSTFDPTISNTFNLSIQLADASDIALLENLTIKVYKNV